MAITGNEKAYTFARSGLARSGATRSGYVLQTFDVDWIVRDQDGNVTNRANLGGLVLVNSLNITQAINDEPDTCSFSIGPHYHPDGYQSLPMPKCGDEIIVSTPYGGTLFHGFVMTVQDDWRLNQLQPPWIAIQCVDPMWRFDARMVTYQFPAQSVTQSIADLVTWFCNKSPTTPHPLDFTVGHVQAMASIPAFDVVNQRPSTVMRSLTKAVGGGFYIDGLDVHAWPNSMFEPGQTNPRELIPYNPYLRTFRRTTDATQVRRRMLVEGRRTSTLIAWPTTDGTHSRTIGLPIQDASWFPTGAPTVPHLVRIGTQWAIVKEPVRVAVDGANPPQTTTNRAFAIGDVSLFLKAMPGVAPPARGWIRVGNQFAAYTAVNGPVTTGEWWLTLAPSWLVYGRLTVPIALGETVEWCDAVMWVESHGLLWDATSSTTITPGDPNTRAQPTDTPVVLLVESEQSVNDADGRSWPQLEGFAQDGRYYYPGAQARANADINGFLVPLIGYEWTTTDPAALPGRMQAIGLLGPEFPGGGIIAQTTILSVDITFQLRTLPPVRRCVGGSLEPSSFMDLVLTETN